MAFVRLLFLAVLAFHAPLAAAEAPGNLVFAGVGAGVVPAPTISLLVGEAYFGINLPKNFTVEVGRTAGSSCTLTVGGCQYNYGQDRIVSRWYPASMIFLSAGLAAEDLTWNNAIGPGHAPASSFEAQIVSEGAIFGAGIQLQLWVLVWSIRVEGYRALHFSTNSFVPGPGFDASTQSYQTGRAHDFGNSNYAVMTESGFAI